MFSHYYPRHQVSHYRASWHKARIDHVAGSLVGQRYLDVVVADHLREWLRLTTYFDERGMVLPSSVHAPEVQEYVAQRRGGRSAPRLRFVRASARLFLETDAAGHCRRRVGGAPARAMSAWLTPIADGMRPSDIRQLRLDNVQWRAGVIAIRQAKTGGPLVLPLLPDVREALVAYLRDGRPATQVREVFIRHRAPFEPFVAANNLSAIMRTALCRVGLERRPGRRGLYLFRHTLATRMLTAECPIKTIGDVLGHVSTDTTMEYANVDLHALRKVSLSEAEVQS